MSYHETVVHTWERNVLFAALVELTYRCNLDCFFCYNDLSLTGRPMRLGDYARLFEDLSGMGCLHLALTGGEPLAHPDFFAIGTKARELGFVIRIKSNGHALRGETLRRLHAEVAPYSVEVSLHGARPETHDRQTRVRGSFARLMSNLREMTAMGLRVKVNATLTRWNEEEVEAMFGIADELGIPLTVDPEVTPRDDGDRSPLSVSASPSGLRRLFELQRSRFGRGSLAVEREGDALPARHDVRKHCGAGSSGIAVDPFGNVFPCVQWRRPVGNLHESSIGEIWRANRGLQDVRRLTERAKVVVDAYGENSPFLSHCPGAAEILTGDPLRITEENDRRARIHGELQRSGELPLPLYPG